MDYNFGRSLETFCILQCDIWCENRVACKVCTHLRVGFLVRRRSGRWRKRITKNTDFSMKTAIYLGLKVSLATLGTLPPSPSFFLCLMFRVQNGCFQNASWICSHELLNRCTTLPWCEQFVHLFKSYVLYCQMCLNSYFQVK